MNDRQRDKRAMFGKVAQFGKDYAADFPANSRGAMLLSQLDGVTDRIDRAAPQQNGGGTLGKEQAFGLLEDLMQGLADTARTAARTLNAPQLRADLRLTPDANEQEWLTDAQRFLDRFDPQQHADAAQVKAEFLDLEMQSDFLANLAAYKRAVEGAQDSQDSSERVQTDATASLAADFASGMDIARHLDTLCENRYGRNPQSKNAVKLREWRQARHLEAPDHAHAAPAGTP